VIARTLKFVVERHPEGHLAYPLEMRGVGDGAGGFVRGSVSRCELADR